MTVKKKCECSVKKMSDGRRVFRHVFRLCLKSRALVEVKQLIWKKKSRPCRQEMKEEAAVRDSPMYVAFVPHDESSTGYAAARHHSGRNQQSVRRATSARASRSGACGRRRKKSGKEIGTRRQVGGMKAPQWILLRILFGAKNANGGRIGGMNPGTPRNGNRPLDGPLSLLGGVKRRHGK